MNNNSGRMTLFFDIGAPLLGMLILTVVVLQVKKAVTSSKLEDEDFGDVAKPQEDDDDDDKIKVFCYFGSQTGTAEGFAKDTATDLTKAGFKAEAFDLEEFDQDDFQENVKYALFFMATYGEGDPCDNSIEFMSFIRRSPEDGGPSPGFAQNVNFTVFGLGNTQYEHYNNMGKIVDKNMEALGGNRLFPLGLGDDDQDLEEDFANWSEGLVDAFTKHAFGEGASSSSAGLGSVEFSESDYAYKALYVPAPEDAELRSLQGRENRKKGAEADLSSRHFFQGVRSSVVVNRELRQDTGPGNTVHVEYELEGTGLSYNTADNLTVCPDNDPEMVELVAKCLQVDLDQWFVLESSSTSKQLFPTPCTLRCALSYFTDLNGAPTRSLLTKLAPFANMPEHRDRLVFLGSKAGKDEYHSYVHDRKLSIADIIETFPSFKLCEKTLGGFLEVMPRLKGRDFTIASSSDMHPNRVALTVGVIREEKPGQPEGRVLKGVCSTYLRGLESGSTSLVFVKESTFKMPSDPMVPIIMIGPGTGIAPMRAFIEQRKYQRDVLKVETGESVLFFGCRRENEDFLYKEELFDSLQSGALTTLHTAFSRQQKEKVYVQHLLEREKENVWQLLQRGAHVYVCGATKMGKDVHTALINVCATVGFANDEAKAKAFVEDLQYKKKYIQELWSS